MKTILAVLLAFVVLPAQAQKLDLSGRSYGGKVRAGPSMDDPQVGSTRPNERIVLLSRAGRMGDFDWFRVRTERGLVGYQWGGLVCADGEETGVLTICGSPQDRDLSGSDTRQAPVPANNVVQYWCGGEGMPMEVRFAEEGEESVAYVTHDGAGPLRMVKPWGSNGDQYAAGANSIRGRNGQLTLRLDGLVLDCRRG